MRRFWVLVVLILASCAQAHEQSRPTLGEYWPDMLERSQALAYGCKDLSDYTPTPMPESPGDAAHLIMHLCIEGNFGHSDPDHSMPFFWAEKGGLVRYIEGGYSRPVVWH